MMKCFMLNSKQQWPQFFFSKERMNPDLTGLSVPFIFYLFIPFLRFSHTHTHCSVLYLWLSSLHMLENGLTAEADVTVFPLQSEGRAWNNSPDSLDWSSITIRRSKSASSASPVQSHHESLKAPCPVCCSPPLNKRRLSLAIKPSAHLLKYVFLVTWTCWDTCG